LIYHKEHKGFHKVAQRKSVNGIASKNLLHIPKTKHRFAALKTATSTTAKSYKPKNLPTKA